MYPGSASACRIAQVFQCKDSLEIIEDYEYQLYLTYGGFTAMVGKFIFSKERDSYEMYYKLGAGDTEVRYKRVAIVENNTAYSFEYSAPPDDYKLFEADADSIISSFKTLAEEGEA